MRIAPFFMPGKLALWEQSLWEQSLLATKAPRFTDRVSIHREQALLPPARTGLRCMGKNLAQKKRATEVAQNALRARYSWKDLRFFALMGVFPDE
ncbi:hypothetical protein HWD95_13520 [Pseudomonas corrugata]|nr:hypothetical protein [Pseudomonas corrugata]